MSWVAIGVGVVGAAGSAYSASQAGGDAPAPVQNDPGKSLLKYLSGLDKGLPQLAGMEGEYRPQFGQLNAADQQQYLDYILKFGSQAQNAAGQQLQAGRQQEYTNMQANTGSVLGILGGVDPNGRQQAQQAANLANDAYTRSQGPLSFQEARGADQQAREAYSARGRVGDTSSVAAEILGRDEVRAGKRAEAASLGANAFQLNQQYTSPALQLLMGTPQSTALGQDYLTNSQSIIGQNTPQFINPDAGINMGAQNASNLNAYNMAQAASKQNSAAAWGQAGSSLLNLAGTIYKK